MTPPPRAIGYIRRDLCGSGSSSPTLAEQHGYRLVYTIFADTGPLISGLVIAQHLHEHDAEAVVVPGFEHAEMICTLITDLAVLITPTKVYPFGYRWPKSNPDSEVR